MSGFFRVTRLLDRVAAAAVTVVWWADDRREQIACKVLGDRCPRCWTHLYTPDQATHSKDCT